MQLLALLTALVAMVVMAVLVSMAIGFLLGMVAARAARLEGGEARNKAWLWARASAVCGPFVIVFSPILPLVIAAVFVLPSIVFFATFALAMREGRVKRVTLAKLLYLSAAFGGATVKRLAMISVRPLSPLLRMVGVPLG